MRTLAILLACTGCDVVAGLDDGVDPCGTASFDSAKTTDYGYAEDATVSWDEKLIVLSRHGLSYQLVPPSNDAQPIILTDYTPKSLSLSPEGTSILFSAMIEPVTLFAAVRGTDAWKIDPNVPLGTFAGTPSADAFGPRRVLVRLRDTGPLQEYEDDGQWKPVGEPHDYTGAYAPNIAPNGLTMVYAGTQADGTPAVFEATRTSPSNWFGDPVVILSGDHRDPQLLGRCQRLYVVDPNPDTAPAEPSYLRRYER